MSDEPKRISYFQNIKDFANKNVIPKVRKLAWINIGKGISIIVAISAIKVFAVDVHKGYNLASGKIRENTETKARQNMVGKDLAHGLAWSHYCGYLQYVLPDLEKKIEDSPWFKELQDEDQQKVKARMPMKLYELIPRKCYVDIQGDDDSIKRVAYITVVGRRSGNKREIKIPIYSIEDEKEVYYCLCECPAVLNTINNVNDIQTAGIFTNSNFSFPWSKKLTWELFTVDKKLVQLMRFYYAMTALLCLENNTKDNARLILLNESEENPTKVLLQAIKEDLEKGRKEKEDLDGQKTGKNDETNKTGKKEDLAKKGKEIEEGKERKEKEKKKKKEEDLDEKKKGKNEEKKKRGKKEDLVINPKTPKQVPRRSLMEKRLLSAEEKKDVLYEFDAFVVQSSLNRSDKKAAEEISQALKEKGLNILLEKDCLGQNWLETLKFAATKCRWIVLLEEKKGSTTNETSLFEKIKFTFLKDKRSDIKTLMSSKVVASLKNVLESRKVQTVAVVNERDELHINDDLRWVTCISYNDNDEQLVDTLCKVVSGSEVELNCSKDLYLKPGDAAVGLAWGYAVNYLNKALPGLKAKKKEIMKGKKTAFNLKEKLFIVVPESCRTGEGLPNVIQFIDTAPATDSPRSYQFTVYKLNENKETYFFGQYAPPVDVIYQMKVAGLITEEQMKSEVKKFYTTVEQIMEILLKGKSMDFEFVNYNDTNESLEDVMSKRIE